MRRHAWLAAVALAVLAASLPCCGGNDNVPVPDGEFSCEDSVMHVGALANGCTTCDLCGISDPELLEYNVRSGADAVCIAIDIHVPSKPSGSAVPCEDPRLVIYDPSGGSQTVWLAQDEQERVRVWSPGSGTHTVMLECSDDVFHDGGTSVGYTANGVDNLMRNVHPERDFGPWDFTFLG